jgi:hypothetical protein
MKPFGNCGGDAVSPDLVLLRLYVLYSRNICLRKKRDEPLDKSNIIAAATDLDVKTGNIFDIVEPE